MSQPTEAAADSKSAAASSDAILRGFAADMSPVAEKIKAILALEDDEERRQAAASLMEELPSLLPDDPELAALMEEDLAKAFAESLTDKVTVANVTDANGNNHAPAGSSDGGQFQGKDEAPESQSEG